MRNLFTLSKKTKSLAQRFMQEEDGVGVVEIILILVVLIALVVLFRDSLQDLVENILQKITTNANAI